jgi:hypothetical protein
MLEAVLGVSDGQAERCLDVLGRLSAYDTATAWTAAAAASRSHTSLTLRAEGQSHAAPAVPASRGAAAPVDSQVLLCDRAGAGDDEPGNTTYRRDLSVSLNKLADLAREAGQGGEPHQWVTSALELRRRLVRDEPGRLDLAIELAYVLYLSTTTGAVAADDQSAAAEAASLLEPFERLAVVTNDALLAWARRTP